MPDGSGVMPIPPTAADEWYERAKALQAEVERLREDLEHRARALATLDAEVERLRKEVLEWRLACGQRDEDMDKDLLTMVRERDEALAEVERLREAITAHQALEYSDMPGTVDADFLIALAEHDAKLYAALSDSPPSDITALPATKYGWAHADDGSACMEPAWCQREHVKTDITAPMSDKGA